MFDVIPDNYKAQTRDNEEEGWRYTQGDKNARRPPELLTRDHVARCIVREIKEGRGLRMAACYLDIPGSRKECPNAENTSNASCRACIISSKQLGDIDITKEPMEVGPTTHYIMGGVHVNADTQMSECRIFAAGECAAGINGAIGSAAIRFRSLYSENAPANSRRNSRRRIPLADRQRKIDTYAREALKAVREQRGENPYSVQRDLQEVMQHNVGIVRDESEMRSALDHLKNFWERAAGSASLGNRDFNPGWHTALDLKNLLTVSEAITRAALERKKVAARNSAKIIRKRTKLFQSEHESFAKAEEARWKFDWSRCRKCRLFETSD
jgi:succinate dehydrogenase / fumarate reductase flavoprotein subunit